MLAAYYTGHGPKLEIREVDVPAPGPGEALIKIETATISAEDRLILERKAPSHPPVVLGREFSGRVVELGSPTFSMPLGTLVAISPHVSCGKCKFCQTGRPHLCFERQVYGAQYDGGFAQFVIVPEKNLFQVPPGVTAGEAALAEPLACCIHGVDRANIRSGDVCVVMGCSTIGMMFIRLLRLAGASRIIVCEPTTHRREAAIKCGADISVKPNELEQTLKKETGTDGPDVVVECAGTAEALGVAVSIAGRGARIVAFGIHSHGTNIPIDPAVLHVHELSIMGSNASPQTFWRAVQMLPVLKIGALLTHTYPLQEINKAFEALSHGIGFRIAIHPNGLPKGSGRFRHTRTE